ncbi:hypothetical protein O181_012610 [Austropuccinia psidii MF-1]|uniref:Uncharacterized protein n=1 Tax=Austropuccinia psidii MF-1 TaxID=1389203 RepID=A0A9Q3BXE9_9BASI|nr:hypothetical protein [Austropuccinia psidii MF-1]
MLKVVMNWMVKRLRWYILPLATNSELHLPNLLPKYFKCKEYQVPPEPSTQSFPQFHLQFLLLHQTHPLPGFTIGAIPNSGAQKLPNGNLQETSTCGQFQQKKRGKVTLPFPATQVFQKRE